MKKKDNVLKSVKLDKRNVLSIVRNDDNGLFEVISHEKFFFFFWRKSDYALDYQTDLLGDKIVSGKYQGFEMEVNAIKWFKFLVDKFSTRIQFIGHGRLLKR